MTLYETTFIINPQTDDATIDKRVKDIAGVITDNQGKIVYEDHMGTRRLAYEINGLAQGYYASFIFEAPTGLLPTLQRYYKLNEAYIRHLTVRFEGDIEKLLESTEVAGEAATPKAAAPAAAPAEEKTPEEPEKEAPDAEVTEAEADATPAEEPEAAPESEPEKADEGADEGNEEEEL